MITPWTDEYTTALRLLWDARKHSARKCAAAINAEFGTTFSRNAVIGKVCRMGWEPHRRSVAVRKQKLRPQDKRRQLREALAKGLTPDPDGAPMGERKQLLELKSNDCRWPFGDPGTPDFFFCGAAIACGSYCASHARVAFNGITGLSKPEQQERLAKYIGRAA